MGEAASLIISAQVAVAEGRLATNTQPDQGAVTIFFKFPTVPEVNRFRNSNSTTTFLKQ